MDIMPPAPSAPLPSPGRIVLYQSATGSGVGYPAIVLRTRASTDPAIIERFGPRPDGSQPEKPAGLVAELPDDTTVDLIVHGLTSDYREFAVPMGDGPRSWGWPPRV